MSKPRPYKRECLRTNLLTAREQTLQLFAEIDAATFKRQIHPGYSPVGWHLGHIGFTEGLWILEHYAGQALGLSTEQRRFFAADGLPKAERQQLPDYEAVVDLLATVRSRVLDYLNIAPLDDQQERLWYWLLQHESQHNETIAFLLQLHRGQTQTAIAYPHLPKPELEMVTIPAGTFVMGSDRLEAQDNERPSREVFIDRFEIDRYPVTNQQYQAFISAGGYGNPDYWSAAGWDWRQSHKIDQPRYWQPDASWQYHPVYGVSYYEAAAYAKWAGKRLPTEMEWEKAACWKPNCSKAIAYPWGKKSPTPKQCNYSHNVGQTTPVNAYPQGQSPTGCWDLLGNVWEWTSSCFEGYDRFAAYPYRGYSEVYFDGRHQVMRGGSWVTREWGLRGSFRNWYHPWTREIFVGFRCAVSS